MERLVMFVAPLNKVPLFPSALLNKKKKNNDKLQRMTTQNVHNKFFNVNLKI